MAKQPPTGQTDHNAAASSADKLPPTEVKVALSSQSSAHRRFNRQDYDEYNRAMRTLGYGIPILKPCPTALTNAAAIGDVGYMRDGEFVKLYNIKDFRGPTVPKFAPKPGLFEGVEKSGMGAIVPPGITSVLAPGSKSHDVTVDANTKSSVGLFPLYGFQLESMTKPEKDGLERFMKDEIQNWTCPHDLTRDDLLLVHSRIMAAKWMMMRIEVRHKDNNNQHFTVNIDEAKVNAPSPASIDFAIEWGVDNLALQTSKPEKSRERGLPSKTTPTPQPLDNNSPIRTSNCVFLGAFRMSGPGRVEDTAGRLVRTTNAG